MLRVAGAGAQRTPQTGRRANEGRRGCGRRTFWGIRSVGWRLPPSLLPQPLGSEKARGARSPRATTGGASEVAPASRPSGTEDGTGRWHWWEVASSPCSPLGATGFASAFGVRTPSCRLEFLCVAPALAKPVAPNPQGALGARRDRPLPGSAVSHVTRSPPPPPRARRAPRPPAPRRRPWRGSSRGCGRWGCPGGP